MEGDRVRERKIFLAPTPNGMENIEKEKVFQHSWVTLNVIILNKEIFPPDADIT